MIPEAPWARVFEAVIDTPNDVEKVRQLVLGRAMRGLLISQVESEGTGAEVLRRLAPLCTGQTAPNESGARWHEVPSSWEWSTLGMVGKIVGGGTPKTDNPEFFSSDGFPWLTPADLNGFRGKQITLGRKRISRAGLANSSAQLLPPGTVLFSSRAPIGYVAIAGCELTTNQGFKSVVPYLPEMAEFLYYYLKSAAVRIDREASGTTFKEVSGRIVSQIPVPIPPLAEQKRIVAKVDELMALCDRLEAQLQERETRHAALARASLARFADAPTPANLHFLFHPSYAITPADLRKSILDLAVHGKLATLAPDDDAVPSIEEFREVAATLAHSLGLRSPKESLDEAEQPFDVPDHWRWMALADLGAAQTGTTPSKSDHEAFNGDIPFIKPADILPDGVNYANESLTRYGAESGSRLAPAGSLLMVCIGTIGKCNLIERECAFNQQINSLSPIQWVDSQYLLLAVRAPYFQDAAWKKSNSTTIAILNKGKWLSIPVPIPPLAEQKRIVAKVAELMALVDQLEAQLAASEEAGTKLLDALVAELAPSS
jgi:type I restriction enzyme S subunit